ncbi:hypothetical protein L8C07_05145 [Paenibacillus sp. CMAA1739]|uniref:hypothetical protein n=1 Tax=Paenibacillus ottowii TaxID=2315729 RepID=UPI002DBE3106|nr:hypothetical protein [Paenibacillus sp. CMAA1739]MEC4565322.1 hypothetical protein [Paenibacillus sp. CMAA1739]
MDTNKINEYIEQNKERLRNHASKKIKEFREQLDNNHASAPTVFKSLKNGQQKY